MANFRSAYYKKILPSVNVQALLTAILEQDPIDIERLSIFNLRYHTTPDLGPDSKNVATVDLESKNFNLTPLDRVVLWKYLLGVTPLHSRAVEFCELQLAEHYDDLYVATKHIHPKLFEGCEGDVVVLDPQSQSQSHSLQPQSQSLPSRSQPLSVPSQSQSLSVPSQSLSLQPTRSLQPQSQSLESQSLSQLQPQSESESLQSQSQSLQSQSRSLQSQSSLALPHSSTPSLDSNSAFMTESEAALILVEMYLLQRTGGPPIHKKDYELLVFRCKFFGQFAPRSQDWFWLFTFFNRRMETVYPGRAATYVDQVLGLLRDEAQALYESHFAKIEKVDREKLELFWFDECYFRTFPSSLSGVLLNVLICDTSGIFSVLGLSMLLILKPYAKFSHMTPTEAIEFLCEPDGKLVEKHWSKIVTLALKLRKKYRKRLLVGEN
eukprot:m.212369 g.212369  ORF g.212369 m.212369 type:complete len:436 (-) comp33124_c0_seq1:170-1477(-)